MGKFLHGTELERTIVRGNTMTVWGLRGAVGLALGTVLASAGVIGNEDTPSVASPTVAPSSAFPSERTFTCEDIPSSRPASVELGATATRIIVKGHHFKADSIGSYREKSGKVHEDGAKAALGGATITYFSSGKIRFGEVTTTPRTEGPGASLEISCKPLKPQSKEN